MTTAVTAPQLTDEKRAEIKQSLKEKLTGKAHAVGSPAAMEEMKKDALTNIFQVNDAALIKQEQAGNLADAIDELAEFTFVKTTAAGLKVLAAGKLLRLRGEDLTGLSAKLQKHANRIADAEGKDLSKPLGKYAVLEVDILHLVNKLSKTLNDLAIHIQEMLEDQATRAWVNKHPDSATKFSKVMMKMSGAALSFGVEGMPPQFKPAAGAAVFLKDVADVAVNEINETRQAAIYKRLNDKGSAFAYLDENPAAMAEYVADGLKTKCRLLLSAAGVGANQLPSWELAIKPALEGAVEGFFDGKVKKLKDDLRAAGRLPNDQKPKSLGKFLEPGAKDIGESLLNTLLDKGSEKLKEALDNLAKDGSSVWGKAVEKIGISMAVAAAQEVLTKVITKIVSKLPIDPAQEVDGAALRAEIAQIAQAGVLTQFHQRGQAQKAEYERPTEDADGNPVEMIVSTRLESDDSGRFLWVRIGGKLGKLYLGNLRFDDTASNDELAKVPTKDKRGRQIDDVRESRTPIDGVSYYDVRIGDVWGLLHPDTLAFTANRPDRIADWSNRKIDGQSYTEEDGTRVEGHWYRPWPSQLTYVFDSVSGKREWANATSLTGNVKGSMEYTVSKIIGRHAAMGYPWEL